MLVRSEAQNAQKILSVLSQFGFGNLDIQADDLQKADNVIQLGVHPNRIDLLTSISGVSFEQAWATRVETEFEGLPIRFIGITELIRNKESIGRARDLGDAEELRKVSKLKSR